MNLPNNALLSAWLRARGMKSGAFGKLIPAKKDVISMILTGKRKPKPEIAKKIEQLTGGDIKAADWIKPGDIT